MFPHVVTVDARFPSPLPLPSGVDARGLRSVALQQALRSILPDMPEDAGKSELLRLYAAHLAAQESEAAGAPGAIEDSLVKQRAERRRRESHDPGKPMSAGRMGPVDTRAADEGSNTGASARP